MPRICSSRTTQGSRAIDFYQTLGLAFPFDALNVRGSASGTRPETEGLTLNLAKPNPIRGEAALFLFWGAREQSIAWRGAGSDPGTESRFLQVNPAFPSPRPIFTAQNGGHFSVDSLPSPLLPPLFTMSTKDHESASVRSDEKAPVPSPDASDVELRTFGTSVAFSKEEEAALVRKYGRSPVTVFAAPLWANLDQPDWRIMPLVTILYLSNFIE